MMPPVMWKRWGRELNECRQMPSNFCSSGTIDTQTSYRAQCEGEILECGDSSPHGSERGDEPPHSMADGLSDGLSPIMLGSLGDR